MRVASPISAPPPPPTTLSVSSVGTKGLMCLLFRYGFGRLFCRYHPVVVGLFMVSFVLFTTLTMIKLVVAVVLDNFGDAVDMDLEKEVCV